MTKKILLLVLALPLIMMVTIFTTTKQVSLAVNVPVSGISIDGSKIIYLDLDQEEQYKVDYTVYPTNAYNQEVTFSYEKYGEARKALLEFKDGYIYPKGVGSAKVTITTNDGGFSDSFIVHVDSNILQSIESSISKTKLFVGETATINTTFVPENAKDKIISYSSSNESVAKVDSEGIVKAVGAGTATIKVYAENNPSIFNEFDITVDINGSIALGAEEVVGWNATGNFVISIKKNSEKDPEIITELYGLDNNKLPANILNYTISDLESDSSEYLKKSFDFEFLNNYVGTVIVKITLKFNDTDSQTVTCNLKRVNEIEAKFNYKGADEFVVGETKLIPFSLTPSDANVRYETKVSNDNISATMNKSNKLIVTALKPGVSTVTLKVISNDNEALTKTIEKEVVVLPSTLDILEGAATYGLENIWTIGKYNAKGEVEKFQLTLSYGNSVAGTEFFENIKWVSSESNVVVDNDGFITIKDDNFTGIVNIYIEFSYEGISKKSTPISIRCVGNGVNVYNYEDLINTTKAKKAVVLQETIKEDFGYINGEYNPSYVQVGTTYDWTYYKNIGYKTAPKVYVLVQFYNDVYGNGKTINAHNVAYGLDESDQLSSEALFRGPLNFVGLSKTGSSAISVKAQDNICFALYDDVTLCNVELRGCDLKPSGEGQYDLVDLSYTGTTVEVFGDDIEIKYSRLTNGRTVLRAFGYASDSFEGKSLKPIHVNISNSILSGAREFIARLGSNYFVDGTYENPSPYIDDSKFSFPVQNAYTSMKNEAKADYDSKYIKTYVDFNNCAFKDSGIFSIGLDAHFAGYALADGRKILNGAAKDVFNDWHELAKTSYGTKVTLTERVAIYDWKKLSLVDSSSLIEIVGDPTGTMWEGIEFDVKKMVDTISEKPGFTDIVYREKDTNQKYVHGGIAFFGGGKNYSVVEMEGYTYHNFMGYPVSLEDVDSGYLQLAAGTQDFYFLLYDRTSSFLPDDQNSLFENGADGYDFVKNNR